MDRLVVDITEEDALYPIGLNYTLEGYSIMINRMLKYNNMEKYEEKFQKYLDLKVEKDFVLQELVSKYTTEEQRFEVFGNGDFNVKVDGVENKLILERGCASCGISI